MPRTTLQDVVIELNEVKNILKTVSEHQVKTAEALRSVENGLNGNNGEPGFKTRLHVLEKVVKGIEDLRNEKRKASIAFGFNLFMFIIQSLTTIFVISKIAG